MATKSYIPAIDETEQRDARAYYMVGFTAAEICERIEGLNINTLRAWITRDGWAKEKAKFDEALRAKHPPKETALEKALSPDKKAENVRIFKEKMGKAARENAEFIADELKPAERLQNAEKIAALSKTDRQNLDLDVEQVGERGHISLVFLNTPQAVRQLGAGEVKELPPETEQ